MMRRIFSFGYVCGIFVMSSGCTAIKNQSDSFIELPQTDKRVIQPDEGDGVYIEGDTIRVRYKTQTNLTRIVDAVAYNLGVSYAQYTDIGKYRINLVNSNKDSDGFITYSSPEEFLSDVVERVNNKYFEYSRTDKKFNDKLRGKWGENDFTFYLLRYRPADTSSTGSKQAVYSEICGTSEYVGSKIESGNLVELDSPSRDLSTDNSNKEPKSSLSCTVTKKYFLRNILVDDLELDKILGDINPVSAESALQFKLLKYKQQNALLIRSNQPSKLAEIDQSITTVDAAFPQILLETSVYQFNDTYERQLGSALNASKDISTSRGSRIFKMENILGSSLKGLPNFFFDLSSTEQRSQLLGTLALNDSRGLVRILAEPRLVLRSGQSAAVKLETSKYVEIAGLQVADVKELKAGVNLYVEPTILGNNQVSIKLKLDQSEFIPTTESRVVQSINTNSVETSLIVDDGQEISIGGMQTQRSSVLTSGVPGLKDTPFFPIFGERQYSKETIRVEFFLKPTINKLRATSSFILNSIKKPDGVDSQSRRKLDIDEDKFLKIINK